VEEYNIDEEAEDYDPEGAWAITFDGTHYHTIKIESVDKLYFVLLNDDEEDEHEGEANQGSGEGSGEDAGEGGDEAGAGENTGEGDGGDDNGRRRRLSS